MPPGKSTLNANVLVLHNKRKWHMAKAVASFAPRRDGAPRAAGVCREEIASE